MTGSYPEVLESCFRAIEIARPNTREKVFRWQAPEAFVTARSAGIPKAEVVDRLETILTGFGLSPDERQRLIAAACEDADKLGSDDAGASRKVADEIPLDDDRPPPPEFSDEKLALIFAECYAESLRYIDKTGRWLGWDGIRWKDDETQLARYFARGICRGRAACCNEKQARLARNIASAKTVAAVERLAQSDRRLVATVDQFDSDPWALNTPAGIIDLRSGRMRPHDPAAFMTKVTAVPPDFEMPTPIWEKFLKRIFDENLPLIEFNQRVAGYALTGSTQEHSLFFCFGCGANGKSTYLNQLIAAVGDYHRTAPIETFTSSTNDHHPTGIAGLRGARMVTAVEVEEGRRWNESRIKALTGADKITARLMRQDFFDFVPQFKLLASGNHKPGLRSVDEAIRRRINLIPFAVTIPPEERDPELADKLKAELPGILAWMVVGCADWQEHGLAPPKIVTDSTAAYLESEDALSAWLDDMAERDLQGLTKISDLFGSWSRWANLAGEFVGTSKRFSQSLESRGFERYRHHQLGRCFRGIRLLDLPFND